MDAFSFRSLSRREFLQRFGAASLITFSATSLTSGQDAPAPAPAAPPNPAITFPGAWQFDLPEAGIILIRDSQLDALQDPDQEVNLSLSETPNVRTLRQICENARGRGVKTIILAFDEFWIQYRKDLPATEARTYYPDSDKFINAIAKISKFISEYGLGLELSLLSPLEIGKGFADATGETGRWVQYREGYRDPATGQFSVSLWEHKRWANNKGTIQIERQDVRVFAFPEEGRFSGEPFYAVDENRIVELEGPFQTVTAQSGGSLVRTTVSGEGNKAKGGADLGGCNRVMVVVSYKTPEMDYFSPKARPYLEGLIQKYYDAGVALNAFYSDEIHIQQDWGYFEHHDEGEFDLRYLSDDFISAFSARYGEQYYDFEKYLVYFLHGQHGFLSNLEAKEESQHVFSPDARGVQETWLFRRRYFDFLHEGVVDLFTVAKRKAEKLYGKKMLARAHATWAQSPTIDNWRNNESQAYKYEYTPNFVWSNTVHQASAACDDYFRWCDFLTGSGNDHAEGGWSDRDYYGQAIACSIGVINDYPNAYAGVWGMPNACIQRHQAITNAYGAQASEPFKAIEELVHRDIEVLMLYPISLVACDERFGSWTVLYGYANYLTAEKLVQFGKVQEDGTIDVRGKRYSTVCALFEPFPPVKLMDMLEEFVAKGGKVVWSGPPAQTSFEGEPIFDRWKKMFGVGELQAALVGRPAPGRRIEFTGPFSDMERQDVMTDFLVDRVFPLIPAGDAVEPLATCEGRIVGVKNGNAAYLGFRPRDDQSASLGYETRTWFEALLRLGAYPPSGKAGGVNDNPTVVSRTTPYLATQFPNGAVVLACHYSRHKEGWDGGFHRDAEQDKKTLEANPLPSDEMKLEKFAVAGHTVDYTGRLMLGFRMTGDGRLLAFYGSDSSKVEIDGRAFTYADRDIHEIAWAPVSKERRVKGGAILEIWTSGKAKVRVPVCEEVENPRLFIQGAVGACGDEFACSFSDGILEFESPDGWTEFYLIG